MYVDGKIGRLVFTERCRRGLKISERSRLKMLFSDVMKPFYSFFSSKMTGLYPSGQAWRATLESSSEVAKATSAP